MSGLSIPWAYMQRGPRPGVGKSAISTPGYTPLSFLGVRGVWTILGWGAKKLFEKSPQLYLHTVEYVYIYL